MLYYGFGCDNATKRAEKINGTCKHIQNDGVAKALQWTGILFILPLPILICLFGSYFCCSETNDVAPSGGSGGLVILVPIGL